MELHDTGPRTMKRKKVVRKRVIQEKRRRKKNMQRERAKKGFFFAIHLYKCATKTLQLDPRVNQSTRAKNRARTPNNREFSHGNGTKSHQTTRKHSSCAKTKKEKTAGNDDEEAQQVTRPPGWICQ